MRRHLKIASLLVQAYGALGAGRFLRMRPIRWAFLHSYFLFKRWFEDPFYSLIRRCPELFRGGHILDVGANAGYTAVLFARAIEPGYRLFAFEPEELNFLMLEETLRERGLRRRVEPIQAAVGAGDGTIEIWHNERHHADHRVRTSGFHVPEWSRGAVARVPLRSLDSFTAERAIRPAIRFVKIDVQGYEIPVLEGMRATIAENPRIVIALEYAPLQLRELGFEPERLLGILDEMHLQTWLLHRDGRAIPADRRRIEHEAQVNEYINLLCSAHPLDAGIAM